MSVLPSIEALSHNAGLGVPARSAWNARCRLLQKGLKGWEEGAAEELRGERGRTAAAVDITV